MRQVPKNNWFRENQSQFSGPLLFEEPLSKYTYYRIGGPASVLAIPKTVDDLRFLAEGIAHTGIRFFILGQGSNILAPDQGFNGLVVKASRFNLEIELCPSVGADFSEMRLRTGGSVAISTLLRRAAQEGWGGLEFLTGIPGSVGGAVTMNAGTHLGEVRGRLTGVEVYSLSDPALNFSNTTYFKKDHLQFQYRKNLFLTAGSLVWSAEWSIEKSEPSYVKSVIDELLIRRKSTQPIDYPSCGSVFKNPQAFGKSAWQVIEHLGLRGHRVGNAQFSEKHSNFIVNLGNAQSADVLALIQLAKTRAMKELGILLEEEVIHLR